MQGWSTSEDGGGSMERQMVVPAVALLAGMTFAGCGGGSSTRQGASTTFSKSPPYAGTSTTHAGPGCTLQPTEDLIERNVSPGTQPLAFTLGNVNLNQCKPTIDTFAASSPTGPGYCSQLARAADNPGYNVDATPAPALHKVLIQIGGAC